MADDLTDIFATVGVSVGRIVECWVECDCPRGADFDIFDPLPGPDDDVPCSECGGSHRAGDIGQLDFATDAGTVGALTEEAWRQVVAHLRARATG